MILTKIPAELIGLYSSIDELNCYLKCIQKLKSGDKVEIYVRPLDNYYTISNKKTEFTRTVFVDSSSKNSNFFPETFGGNLVVLSGKYNELNFGHDNGNWGNWLCLAFPTDVRIKSIVK